MMRRQLIFAAKSTPFWRSRLDLGELESPRPFTRSDLEKLPLLHKKLLRMQPRNALLPDSGGPYYIVRGSGGTTGDPVAMSWTQADWEATQEVTGRFLKHVAAQGPTLARAQTLDSNPTPPPIPLIVWNGYNQGHVSGPSFDDAVRRMGGTPVVRHFRMSDAESLQDIMRLKANALIITPKSGSGKGGSLEDLLAADPDFLAKAKITALMLSSTPLDADLLEEIRGQGVKHIVNFYGSTEALPTAISCEEDPRSFHLCPGPNFVEVVDSLGVQVKNGERGMVVVSRLGSSPKEGGMACHQGSQIIRFIVGDVATFTDTPCRCGRTTARISNIERTMNVEDKLAGGCEKWE